MILTWKWLGVLQDKIPQPTRIISMSKIEYLQCGWDDKAHVAKDAVLFGFDVHIRNENPHQWQESVHDHLLVENKFRSWTSPIAAAFIALKRSPARDNSDADRPSPDPPGMIYKAKNGRAFTASEKECALFKASNHFTRLQDCLLPVTECYTTVVNMCKYICCIWIHCSWRIVIPCPMGYNR